MNIERHLRGARLHPATLEALIDPEDGRRVLVRVGHVVLQKVAQMGSALGDWALIAALGEAGTASASELIAALRPVTDALVVTRARDHQTHVHRSSSS